LQGQGVKVAVLDSGFQNYQSFLGKALPATVTVKSFRRDGNLEARDSQHGILCGEVVHAVAPEAELLFINWEPDVPESLCQAMAWAKGQGAKVLSCSLIMPCWSDGEGGGTIHQALSRIVGIGSSGSDVLFFASAGNLAQRHWCGPFQPDSTGYHQWTPGHRHNALTPWGEDRVSVELYGHDCHGLELQVHDTGSGQVVGRCRASLTGSPCGCPCAVVRFLPQAGGCYDIRLRCDKAEPLVKLTAFHLAVLGGTMHYTTACGSIPFPADGAETQAVGAVDSDGRRFSYSSCGPNSPLPKPDFVAEVPFQSSWRDRPFGGTSAAAPQAAGLAALLWARHPSWTAKQVSHELRRASLDLGPMGHDWQTGHGLLRLPR
jgi:subtilisin family serine protease